MASTAELLPNEPLKLTDDLGKLAALPCVSSLPAERPAFGIPDERLFRSRARRGQSADT